MRQVAVSGIITTFIGTGATDYTGENVAGTSANLNLPVGMAIDSDNGDFVVGDFSMARIFVMTASSALVSTFAGDGSGLSGGDGGAATAAQLKGPDGMYWDQGSSQLYIAEQSGCKIRLAYSTAPTNSPASIPSMTPTASPTSARSSSYSIKVFAGSGSTSSSGSEGMATAAGFSGPRSVWLDTAGVVYVVEGSGHCIRAVDSTNIIRAFAGSCGTSGSTGDGGAATSALFRSPTSLFISSTGSVYLSDNGNNKARTVSASGFVSISAGTGTSSDSGDGGEATSAGVKSPNGIWANSVGVLYFDSSAARVRSVSTSNIITTFAGL